MSYEGGESIFTNTYGGYEGGVDVTKVYVGLRAAAIVLLLVLTLAYFISAMAAAAGSPVNMGALTTSAAILFPIAGLSFLIFDVLAEKKNSHVWKVPQDLKDTFSS